MNNDLYALLEVARGASARQITSAFRRLARAYHPDRNAAPGAADQFKAVAHAYAVLSDAARRRAYDLWGDTAAVQSRPRAHSDTEESAWE
jgi:DnaJ-class molecular chaperone